MFMESQPEKRKKPVAEKSSSTRNSELRCRRCNKPVEPADRDGYFARTTLCFWCAYIDTQG
jgi:hypothetical protein